LLARAASTGDRRRVSGGGHGPAVRQSVEPRFRGHGRAERPPRTSAFMVHVRRGQAQVISAAFSGLCPMGYGHGKWHHFSVPVLDLEQLKNITMDDADLMREILITLISDTSRQLLALERAVSEADAKETVRVAHYSKGACANVGATSTARILQEIE